MKVVVLTTALLLAFGPATVTVAQTPGAEGVDVVDVIKTTATVEKVDLEKRKVTVRLDDGKSKTIKVDKSIRNLDQVNVGDHLKLAYAEEMIVTIGNTGENVGSAAGALVAVAPKGSKPGGVMVETAAMTGKVVSVDAEKHRVVLEEPDGKKKTVKVSKKVNNLNQLQAGQTIDITITEALAIEVAK